jgi:hypothetical protein
MADTDNSTTELVNEHLLIEQLGIPLKKIRALRPVGVLANAGGVFWPLPDATALALSVGAALALAEKNPAPGAPEEMQVVSQPYGGDGRHFPNPKVIKCLRKNGAFVFVAVTHSKLYDRKLRDHTGKPAGRFMFIRAVPANGGVNWTAVGNQPSYRGQW